MNLLSLVALGPDHLMSIFFFLVGRLIKTSFLHLGKQRRLNCVGCLACSVAFYFEYCAFTGTWVIDVKSGIDGLLVPDCISEALWTLRTYVVVYLRKRGSSPFRIFCLLQLNQGLDLTPLSDGECRIRRRERK